MVSHFSFHQKCYEKKILAKSRAKGTLLIFDPNQEGMCSICVNKNNRAVEKLKLIRNDGQNIMSLSICNDYKMQLFLEFKNYIHQQNSKND